MIFYHQIFGESNAAKSLVSLDVVSILPILEGSRILFVRTYNHNIGSDGNTRDGSEIAMYYNRIFGLFAYKSNIHFLHSSTLKSYAMKPNMGLTKIYRLLHVMGILRFTLAGGFYEEEE